MIAVSVARRCAALIAAYAVALQALLAAFGIPLAAAPASASGWELCLSGETAGNGALPAHDPCSACVAGHCAPASGVPPAAVATLVRTARAGMVASSPKLADLTTQSPRGEAHFPRAPPLA